jgi:ABC-2 type transport system ATP-binding protein
MLRTVRPAEAAAALARAGGSVAGAEGDGDALIVTGLAAGDVVGALSRDGVPFSEVSGHRATLEQAYLELTRDQVDYRAQTAGEVPA